MLRQLNCGFERNNSEVRWGSEWGGGEISLQEKTNASLKLRYCLQAIASKSGKLLEVGCGQGKFLRAIRNGAKEKRSTFGCDIDVANLLKIRALYGNNESNRYCAGDIGRLPFADQSFYVVLFFDVLEHVEGPEKSVRELNRIMKSEALLHTFIPCEGNVWTLHGLLFRSGLARNLKKNLAGHINQFTTKQVLNMFSRCGFELKRIRYSGYLLEQLFDLAFYIGLQFSWLHSILARAHTESEILAKKQADSGFKKVLISFFREIKNVLFRIAYYESLLLAKVPYSLGIHATFQKVRGFQIKP